MKTTKKRTYHGRNTGMFYALMGQLPGFDRRYQDVIKESIVNEFFERECGKHHGRDLKISTLSDMEYNLLIRWLRGQVNEAKTKEALQDEAIRKGFIHKIIKDFHPDRCLCGRKLGRCKLPYPAYTLLKGADHSSDTYGGTSGDAWSRSRVL